MNTEEKKAAIYAKVNPTTKKQLKLLSAKMSMGNSNISIQDLLQEALDELLLKYDETLKK